MIDLIKKYPFAAVGLWGAILFIPFLGAVHLFDWDEINFAESAREMLVTGNFMQVQINYMPFIEKPPLFFWLQAISMKIFGVGEYAARLPNAVIGIIALLSVFYIAKKHYSKKVAFLWVMFITGSFTPHLYYKSGIIDPLYNLLIFASIYQFYCYIINTSKIKHCILLGFFLGLAVITKGPVAILIVLLCFLVYWVMQKMQMFFSWKHVFLVAFVCFIVSFAWFGAETIKNGPTFIVEFVKYQIDLFLNPVAGHGQPFWYHAVVLLFGAFPASVIAMPLLVKKIHSFNNEKALFLRFMQILFWVTFILFSIVETKIVHYSSLCYLPLTFLAAVYTVNLFENGRNLKKWQIVATAFIGILLGILFSVVTLVDILKADLIPHIDDEFAVGNLSVDGGWRGYEIFCGLFLLSTIIVSLVQFIKKKLLTGLLLMLLSISLFIPVFLRIVVPHIETYSQRSAIEFYKQLQGQNCYVATVGFKSYAQYFYARVMPQQNPNVQNMQWLLNDSIDKPAYFVLKEGSIKDHINPTMEELYRKGGFVFFKRNIGVKFNPEQTEQ
ncbi:MAG: ArnT family glycosyltransferase [Bacteroidia bacterium]